MSKSTSNLHRRAVFGLGMMSAAGVAVSTLNAEPAQATVAPMPRPVTTSRRPEDFGAIGDGVHDDTAALAHAIAASARDGKTVELTGTYRFTQTMQIPSSVALCGASQIATLAYEGRGIALLLHKCYYSSISNLRVSVEHPQVRAVVLDAAFRCNFFAVHLVGNYWPERGRTDASQVGISLTSNAGDNRFTNCDIDHFGKGIYSAAIMNYLNGCVVSYCRYSVYGGDPRGQSSTAGISLIGCSLVAPPGGRYTRCHVRVVGSANSWWLTNVWIEGGTDAVCVGRPRSGPMVFALTNSSVAASSTVLCIQQATVVILSAVSIGRDPGTRPKELEIARSVRSGSATGVMSTVRGTLRSRAFPSNWTVT